MTFIHRYPVKDIFSHFADGVAQFGHNFQRPVKLITIPLLYEDEMFFHPKVKNIIRMLPNGVLMMWNIPIVFHNKNYIEYA